MVRRSVASLAGFTSKQKLETLTAISFKSVLCETRVDCRYHKTQTHFKIARIKL